MAAKRRYQRIPFQTEFFFLDSGIVYSTHTSNLSQGGFLLENIPVLPNNLEVMFLAFIPEIELFADFDWVDDMPKELQQMKFSALRERGYFHLRKQEKEDVSTLFRRDIIVEIDHVPDQIAKIFNHNTENYKKNVEYLLARINSVEDLIQEDRVRLKKYLSYLGINNITLSKAAKLLEETYQKLQW